MAQTVRFILGDEIRELTDIDPTMTVLTYLRTVERRTGTKEGCAEGDCGACTVVLGIPDGDRVRYRAVDSCILFVATLDGKQLITVEDLRDRDGSLHPVQQAMVDCHGSQCGFCTPGFVMSLFALYHCELEPSDRRISDVLAGNLCRCTGYRPIIEAARRMYANGNGDRFAARESAVIDQLRSIQRADTLTLMHGGRTYYAPVSLSALASLVERHPDARLLSGGTDLGLLVTKQHEDLDTLIYLGDVRELQTVRADGDQIEIGAAATFTDAFDAVAGHYPDFGELLRRFGSVQVRNTGTLAGNIATASPIGDSLPALMALDARLVLRRGGTTREVGLEEFFVGYRRTAMQPGEFIERIRIPIHTRRRFAAYKISKRFDQDIASVCAAYSLALDGSTVRDIRIAYGGMAPTPRRARLCEQALAGCPWNEATVEQASPALDRDFAPITDLRASAAYRSLVARNLLRKFQLETTHGAVETRIVAYAEHCHG